MPKRKYTPEELQELMCLRASGAAGAHRDNSGATRRKRTRGSAKRAAVRFSEQD